MIRSLRTPAEFRALRATGRRVSAGPLTMIISDATDPQQTGVAYAVGRRVGNAVQRNRIRRRLRPIMADLDRAGALPAASYLVICGVGSPDLDHRALTTCLSDALGRSAA